MPDETMAATALEALFDLDPSAAAAIAEARLKESLSNDCVPSGLVKLLHERHQRVFEPIAERLEDLGCDRQRLRPPGALFPGENVEGLSEEARAFASRVGGSCGKAFLELIGPPDTDSP